jgi:hypothetical protein
MTQSLRLSQRSYLDTESRAMIYEGCSSKQLAEIFGMKEPDVMRKLAGLDAVGMGRQGNPLYRIRDAAARLVKIPVTPEMIQAHLRRMNPKDLPPVLNKMFWEGLTARRKYEEVTGDMWQTADVIQVASDAYQALRMSVLLIPDLLSEETELSDEQMKAVQSIIDTALEAARERLLSLRKPSRLRSGPVAEEEPI